MRDKEAGKSHREDKTKERGQKKERHIYKERETAVAPNLSLCMSQRGYCNISHREDKTKERGEKKRETKRDIHNKRFRSYCCVCVREDTATQVTERIKQKREGKKREHIYKERET